MISVFCLCDRVFRDTEYIVGGVDPPLVRESVWQRVRLVTYHVFFNV